MLSVEMHAPGDIGATLAVDAGFTLEGCYAAGLERVAKVIEGVKDYDSILGDKRIDRPEYTSIVATFNAGEKERACNDFIRMIKSRKSAPYNIPANAKIVTYANTHNNKREIDFFKRTTQEWCDVDTVELSACERLPKKPICAEIFSENFGKGLRTFLFKRTSISRSHIHQLLSYTVAYCTVSEDFSQCASLQGVVLANDHSPIPVALSMAAKHIKITRIYIQHAEVTPIFPALDFEYSILRNKKSERIYRSMGEPTGLVEVVDRSEKMIDIPEIQTSARFLVTSPRVKVGVYPSSVLDQSYLRRLVEALHSNDNIEQVFIKPHPAVDLSVLAEAFGVQLHASSPAEPHVAIVGNSSVSLELALSGHLVFQDFNLDEVGRDYYGFVRDGLTSEITLGLLTKQFWANRLLDHNYDNALIAYAGQDSVDQGDLQRKEFFFKKMLIDIGAFANIDHSLEASVRQYLNIFPRTFLAIMREEGLSGGNDFAIIKALDSLFAQRIISLADLSPLIDQEDCRSVMDFWLAAKRIEWNGEELTEKVRAACANFIFHYERDKKKALSWMESKYFDLLLRANRPEALLELLKKARSLRMATSGINRKIAFARFIESYSGQNKSEFMEIYDYRKDSFSDFDRLKFVTQSMLRVDGELLHDGYEAVERMFLDSAPAGVVQDYRNLVLPAYQKIGDRAKYIDIKRDARQEKDLLDLIVGKLKDRRGFSLLRLGDGEGYFFLNAGKEILFSSADAKNRERHWWGTEVEPELRNSIIEAGLKTVANADVLGIPTVYRFVRDSNGKSTTLLAGIQGRGLVSVLHGVSQFDSEGKIYADMELNRSMFGNKENLKKLADAAERIVIINGAKEDVIREKLGDIGELSVISIPTHNKTAHNDRFTSAPRPLAYVFEEIRAVVERSSGPGVLVLVGAGVAGKSFIDAAKRAGGVGLDVGSALDELIDAGIHSLH